MSSTATFFTGYVAGGLTMLLVTYLWSKRPKGKGPTWI